jgi:hypothetical protein
MRRIRMAGIFLFCLMVSLAGFPEGKRVYGFKGGVNTRAEKGLTREEAGFHEPEGKFFTQSWTFVYYLDDRSGGYLQFTYMRMGYFLDRLSGQHSYFDPDGNLWFSAELAGGSDWSFELEPWRLRMGRQEISGFYPEFTVKSEIQGISTDLHFLCKVPGWRPGEGPAHYGSPEGDWYDLYVVIPWAEVSGTIMVDGEARKVHGFGYMDHNVQTVFFTAQVQSIHALRSFSAHYAIHILEYLAPEGFEPKRLAWLLIMKDDRIIFATDKYTLEPSDYVEDNRADYPYPTRVKVKVDLPGCRLTGTIRCTGFMEFLDVMDQIPEFLHGIADRLFKQPAFVRQLAEVDWQIRLGDIDEHVRAEGIFEVAFVN